MLMKIYRRNTARADNRWSGLPESGAERNELESRFQTLHDQLLNEVLEAAPVARAEELVKRAATEAAGLAWTTPYPTLVFPVLFAEIESNLRVRARRQDRIASQSRGLLELAR